MRSADDLVSNQVGTRLPIDRYAVLVYAKNAGFGLASMVHVSFARHEQTHVEHFIREVMQHPEVLEVLKEIKADTALPFK